MITSSPYKMYLEEAKKKQEEKEVEKKNKLEKIKEKENNVNKKRKSGEEKDAIQDTKKKVKGLDKIKKEVLNRKTPTVKRKLTLDLHSSSENSEEGSIDSGESVLETDIGVENPGDKDAICIFCEGLYSKDTKGELWVQCLMCEMWAHNECAGCETDHYICDFCKP